MRGLGNWGLEDCWTGESKTQKFRTVGGSESRRFAGLEDRRSGGLEVQTFG